MITSKFYSQTYVCPRCQGTGVVRNKNNKVEQCDECGGGGVFLMQSDNIYYLGVPSYIDYKGRVRILINKIIFSVIAFVAILMLLILGMSLYRSVFTHWI